jgi:hypothetical protein
MTDLSFDAPAFEPRKIPWGTLASLGLHGGLALAVILLSPIRDLVAPPPEPVAVEIVTEQQFAALEQPAEAAPPVLAAPAPAEEAAPPAPGEQIAPSGPLTPDLPENPVVTATEFYAANLLRQPDMQRIRQGIRGFADSERMVQICNIEALEQIKRAAPAFDPDTMVAYAMADMMWQGMTLTAAGGAFRSRRLWYGVAFHCTVAAGYEAVTAFDFKLGDPIPEDEWEEHSLNAADADDD